MIERMVWFVGGILIVASLPLGLVWALAAVAVVNWILG